MLLRALTPCLRSTVCSPTRCHAQPSRGHDAAGSTTAQPLPGPGTAATPAERQHAALPKNISLHFVFLLAHGTVTKLSKSIIFLQLFVYFFSPLIYNWSLWVGGLGAPKPSFGTGPFPSGQGRAAKGHGTNTPLRWCHELGMAGCHGPGGSWGGQQGFFLEVQFKSLDVDKSEGQCSTYPPGPAQARAEASSSIQRMLCLPRAPSPGNPAAAVCKNNKICFLFMCRFRLWALLGGTGMREEVYCPKIEEGG